MRILPVKLGPRSYNIIISHGFLPECGYLLRERLGLPKVVLVSNPNVFALYGEEVLFSLTEAGFKTTTALMPDGEQYKNMQEAGKILDVAVESGLERGSAVIALGGGVVGDLAGFVASIYQRGISFVQIPTTLLAQVDSSVGGKVAVNHPRGKNLIGAFHQPAIVLIDVATLATLEERDYISGLGEVVKYGIIYDQHFFNFLEDNSGLIKKRESIILEEIVNNSCRIKGAIVEEDETEQGLRAILNLGHTFGHSLEKLGGYEMFRHGEAVAMGTIAAVLLAEALHLISPQEVDRIIKLHRELGLPVVFPDFDPQEVYQVMLNDKKVKQEKLRLVLPAGIGKYVIRGDIDSREITSAIKKAGQI